MGIIPQLTTDHRPPTIDDRYFTAEMQRARRNAKFEYGLRIEQNLCAPCAPCAPCAVCPLHPSVTQTPNNKTVVLLVSWWLTTTITFAHLCVLCVSAVK